MRFYRVTFVGGLAIGYVLGAQAGRERYEQLKRLARKATENPAVQQTAGALQAQASATAKTAKDKAATGVRRSASKVAGKRSAGSRADQASNSMSGNGASSSAAEGDGSRPFVPVDANFAEHDVL